MYSRGSRRYLLALLVGLSSLATTACHKHEEPAAAPKSSGPATATSKNEIAAAELSAVMAAHFQGVGCMEQYEYGNAAKAFREVRRLCAGLGSRCDQPGRRTPEHDRRGG